jgi:hypothetical protein
MAEDNVTARSDDVFDQISNALVDNERIGEYYARHGLMSQPVLTITNDEIAGLIAEYLRPIIENKTVIEIGGGNGLLSLHMGMIAKRVFCIEANPIWADSFIMCLIANKPKNVSYLFGAADEFAGLIKGDVAVFASHSGVDGMRKAGCLFAITVIDIYGEIINKDPSKFDEFARMARLIA